MAYDAAAGTLSCQGKKRKGEEDAQSPSVTIYSALDWLAALVTHIPDKGQQLLRYYGHYSNVGQAQKKRASTPAQRLQTTPRPPEQEDEFRKQCRRNWTLLIRKIYEVNPLICTRCGAIMRIISLCAAFDYVK